MVWLAGSDVVLTADVATAAIPTRSPASAERLDMVTESRTDLVAARYEALASTSMAARTPDSAARQLVTAVSRTDLVRMTSVSVLLVGWSGLLLADLKEDPVSVLMATPPPDPLERLAKVVVEGVRPRRGGGAPQSAHQKGAFAGFLNLKKFIVVLLRLKMVTSSDFTVELAVNR
ncbi:hypothetical protein KRP22_000166 [Phytophthora ramorum]|nr:hypothetical protein KRP22_12112 [Phytophthora ramorum]